jgi:CD109 antigen
MNMLTVKSNTGSTISFTVTPRKVGYLPIKITARCEMAGDAIEQLLLVEPGGSPIYVNKAILLDMRNVYTKSLTLSIDTPDVAVPDSTSAEVSVFGDLMGNTIQNLDRLIRIPSGCGEQNMVAFVPNLLVANYLKTVQQLTTLLWSIIVRNLEIGYQRELNYQRKDGSFSCWGKSDSSGSTWLTAFVVRYFAEAKAYISIDDNVLTRAMDWLVSKQSENGRFTEVGKGVIYELQSEASEGVGLTAYVLLALMANNPANKYDVAIKKATDYIVERLTTVDHLYSLALSAYALQKQGHSSAAALLDKLNKKAKDNDGLKWWENNPSTSANYWWSYTSTTNIEITAIALTTYAEAGMDTEAFPILQWLIKERNSRGGYYSTQDTILSIQALTRIASRLYVNQTDINVAITYEPEGLFNVKVNRANVIALQSFELSLNTKSINFDCQGRGFAVAQVAYKYYVLVPEPAPRFNLDVKIRDSLTAKKLNLTVCSSFIADEQTKSSNMAIVEVTFPSGYTFDRDTLDKLRSTSDVSVSSTDNFW